jgi:hypothetical protein
MPEIKINVKENQKKKQEGSSLFTIDYICRKVTPQPLDITKYHTANSQPH